MSGSKLKLRRLSQIVSLALFLLLLHKGGTEAHLFLRLDPLVAITNALSTRALYRGLLWSLAILIPTLFLGRFFCGWICPLGTLSQLVGRAGRPPAAVATRSRRLPSKCTPGVYDSVLTLTSTPWVTADDSAAAVISATTAATSCSGWPTRPIQRSASAGDAASTSCASSWP